MEAHIDRSVLASKLRGHGFSIVEPLKGGGHAAMFCVRKHESEEASVAKVVVLTGLDAQAQASAHQEVSLLKGLSAHPNLIDYRENFLDANGILFIIMSLAEDGDLRSVVTQAQAVQRVIPEPAVVTWLRQVLMGLEHLHNQDVVHRDLKSSNIFLCEGRRRIRIGDFGISTVLQSTAFASSCVGTPAYMSPELMRNERYDFHVDMWALGCISFELATLKLPFAATSLLQLAVQVIERDPTWEKMEGRSEELKDLTSRLLKKDVNARPSASDLLQEPLMQQPDPSEEDWASLNGQSLQAYVQITPEKRKVQSTVSTSAVSGSESGSFKEAWSTTPRMPWDVSDNGSTRPNGTPSTASSSFERIMQRARDCRKELSKDEFAHLLSTHQEQLMAELNAGLAGAIMEGTSQDENSNNEILVSKQEYEQLPKRMDQTRLVLETLH
mmetsp:Transcript_98791/g.175933  ORF Transcript_98791/g.175933 Transcript_98791/m.175933 type:complete len:441 (-) Transcript_98791:71-1393(-)|eukprot:CAMPEP_0197661254 /NCGR_PEP_ID=MMETSP1338-20131121/51346_1 /TAXON_ID=43686 ORGANISM="Pelagodinium beii, Strain RCC1491" /NCGR_SAMPLE_ID=MMETSP1338 /ASSEMBLY_ACC=CAM_ASM_000754 /LENGTH=440 /DNA_ID=CAMNT_0043238773 /DNA_START=44 /DNA_END=1366 /DNA_ORIENTATION=-